MLGHRHRSPLARRFIVKLGVRPLYIELRCCLSIAGVARLDHADTQPAIASPRTSLCLNGEPALHEFCKRVDIEA
jgi:hypothetical protein